MRRLGLALLVLAGLAAPAAAADLAKAEALYRAGTLEEAAELALAAGGPEGLSLAAKATLVEALYRAPEDARPLLLEHAADHARAALALDPQHVDALIDLALALGHKADLAGPITAHLNGYATDGKALLDKALAIDPDNAWAHGLLGIWHLQVVRFAADALAEELYGASREAGLEHCARAEALGPEDLALRYGCAVSMLELDAERYGGQAKLALEAVRGLPARDAAEALVRADAERLLAELEVSAARPADSDD